MAEKKCSICGRPFTWWPWRGRYYCELCGKVVCRDCRTRVKRPDMVGMADFDLSEYTVCTRCAGRTSS